MNKPQVKPLVQAISICNSLHKVLKTFRRSKNPVTLTYICFPSLFVLHLAGVVGLFFQHGSCCACLFCYCLSISSLIHQILTTIFLSLKPKGVLPHQNLKGLFLMASFCITVILIKEQNPGITMITFDQMCISDK